MKLMKVLKVTNVLLMLIFAPGSLSDDDFPTEKQLKIPYQEPVQTGGSVLFWESFQKSSTGSPVDFGWVLSTKEEYLNQEVLVDELNSAFEGDKALLLKKKHVRYGLSKKLPKPVSLDEDELIIQFDTRFHDKISCSGAYIKFIAETDESQENFSEKTPYVLMFGPDKCGNNEKIHTIFRHENPISGEYEEKHMVDLGKFTNDQLTHVYTLHIKKENQDVSVFVDREERKSKSALSSDAFKPSFMPPEEVDDVDDKKPESWVEEQMMPDPQAKKPDDWVDLKLITDPESKRPDDWDDEEDGEWEPAKIENPDYLGEWKAPMIENPSYKGQWEPRKIKNPHYFEQKFPLSNLPKISHVFIEVLANDQDIEFDNILITSSAQKGQEIAETHSLIKQSLEKEINSERKLKEQKESREKALEESFSVDTVYNYILGEMNEIYERNPVVVLSSTGVATLIVFWLLLRPKINAEDVPVEEVVEEEKNESEVKDDTDENEAKARRRPRRAD